MPTFKVLVVEDDVNLQRCYAEDFPKEGIEYIGATTVVEALKKFKANPDISVITMDGSVPVNEGGSILGGPTTLALVRAIRGTFKGPMICCSDHPDYREALLAAGCSHECEKHLVVETTVRILNELG